MPGPIRKPLFHPVRALPFTSEALALFAALEARPRHRRSGPAYKDNERELMRMLNLVPEWWVGCSVLDDAEAPPWPPRLAAYGDWHKVRGVREVLLEAAELQAAG